MVERGTGNKPVSIEGGSDKAAWVQAALAQYEGPLLRYAARLVGNVERGREVVQDTFLRLCERNPAELNGDLACWLFTVCRRRSLDVRKKELRVTTATMEKLDTTDGSTGPAEAMESRQEQSKVQAAVAELPEREQEIIRLKFEAGLSYKQIAEVMELSVGNVGFLLHTAIGKLRQQLGERTK